MLKNSTAKATTSILKHLQNSSAYEFYNSIGAPKFVLAPMVEQSELAFRMLTRKYGTQLCYSPMLYSKIMVKDKSYKQDNFSTCLEDRPLIVQFCGNDPDIMLDAAQMVENECDAVDINLGCPQGIARRGQYGSFLLENPELICKMVDKLAKGLKVPVSCKIRILPKEEDTIDLVKKIEGAGCSLLTVHGRTRKQNKHLSGTCNWDIIKKIKETVKIPVLANGGIHTFEDVEHCMEYTGVDGVMSAESILENPALFSGKLYNLDELALEYIELTKQYPTKTTFIKQHLFKMLHTGLQKHTYLRDKLAKETKISELTAIAAELKQLRENEDPASKLGWYQRHRGKNLQDGSAQLRSETKQVENIGVDMNEI